MNRRNDKGDPIPNIVFRLDVNPKTGFSHLARCLTLASAIRETDPSSEIMFITSNSNDHTGQITNEGFRHEDLGMVTSLQEDLDSFARVLQRLSPDLLVVDNPSADENYLAALHERTPLLAVIEDSVRLSNYPATVIINPNLNAHLLRYPCDSETLLLLGTDYCPIPKEFDQYQDFQRSNPEKAKNVLISFRDGDPRGVSLDIVRAIKNLDEQFLATVMVGKNFHKGEELGQEIGLDSRFMVLPECNDIARRMASSDIIICDPGDLYHSSLLLGLPAMLVGYSASDAPVVGYASTNALALPLGEAGSLDAELVRNSFKRLLNDKNERDRMSARSADVVDGLGRFRVAEELLALCTVYNHKP